MLSIISFSLGKAIWVCIGGLDWRHSSEINQNSFDVWLTELLIFGI
jgi:hypothetical protein